MSINKAGLSQLVRAFNTKIRITSDRLNNFLEKPVSMNSLSAIVVTNGPYNKTEFFLLGPCHLRFLMATELQLLSVNILIGRISKIAYDWLNNST